MISMTALLLIYFFQKIDFSHGGVGGAAIADGVIGVSALYQGILLYDTDLNYLRRISTNGSSHLLVFSLGDALLVTNNFSKYERALLIEKGKIKRELDVFKPRMVSSDGDTLAILPGLNHSPDIAAFEMKWPPRQDLNLIQKIELRGKKIVSLGNRMMPLTAAQRRDNFNWKGFWIFEDRDKKLEIINQADPAVFRERTETFHPIDIPNFVFKDEPHPITDKIYTWPEFRHAQLQRLHGRSRIEGVYRYDCGFVLCYIDPGYPWPEFYRLAFFDEDWNRYGQIQEIPGKLIGVYQDQGYLLTFLDDAGFSELRKVDLQP